MLVDYLPGYIEKYYKNFNFLIKLLNNLKFCIYYLAISIYGCQSSNVKVTFKKCVSFLRGYVHNFMMGDTNVKFQPNASYLEALLNMGISEVHAHEVPDYIFFL